MNGTQRLKEWCDRQGVRFVRPDVEQTEEGFVATVHSSLPPPQIHS